MRFAFALIGLALLAGFPARVRADEDDSSLKPLPAAEWDRDKAAHLLRRAGFGGTPDEIDRLFDLGLDGAVAQLVNYDKIAYECAPPALDPLITKSEDRPALRALSEEERQKIVQQRQLAERRGVEETRLWWIERMAASPRPLEEKMTLFWHGHFTSGAREVRRALFMKEQNELLRKHALGNFRDLVIAISKDRAMLVYLDGARNNKKQPNENYARELMELFTLGVGNYSEQDIKAAARAFTGWSFDDDGYVFRPRNHDDGEKAFLGKKGKFNGEDIVDIILDQPECSKYLARCLLEYFVRPDPDKQLVNSFAAVIRKHKYALRPALATLFKSEAFYAPAARGTLVRGPVELLINTSRSLGIGIQNPLGAERALAAMGQELLQPPNVKGWDGGRKWINTATLFLRYNYVGKLINGEDQADVRRQQAMRRAMKVSTEVAAADDGTLKPGEDSEQPMMAASRLATGKQGRFDPLPIVEKYKLDSAEQIVDFFTNHLLAVPLADEKRSLLVAFLRGDQAEFDSNAKDADERLRKLIHLICSTPEYQMY